VPPLSFSFQVDEEKRREPWSPGSEKRSFSLLLSLSLPFPFLAATYAANFVHVPCTISASKIPHSIVFLSSDIYEIAISHAALDATIKWNVEKKIATSELIE